MHHACMHMSTDTCHMTKIMSLCRYPIIDDKSYLEWLSYFPGSHCMHVTERGICMSLVPAFWLLVYCFTPFSFCPSWKVKVFSFVSGQIVKASLQSSKEFCQRGGVCSCTQLLCREQTYSIAATSRPHPLPPVLRRLLAAEHWWTFSALFVGKLTISSQSELRVPLILMEWRQRKRDYR